MADGLVGLLRREHISRGVKIAYFPEQCEIGVTLHIVVEYGVNIPAISRSIMSEVRYVLEKCTGIRVGTMSVFIDAMMLGGTSAVKPNAALKARKEGM